LELEHAFGVVLKRHRKALSLSQEELALRCNLDRTFIGLLERGERRPTLKSVFVLAQNLNVSPSDLVREVEKQLTQDS